MASKPWIGALVAPSNAPSVNMNAPTMKLELKYINGFRTDLGR
jgi:hypothetical protein